MLKIMFMIHDLSVGGAEKVLVNLVNNLDQTKFDISVIALFGGGVNEQFLKPHIHYRAVFPKMVPGNSKLMKLLTPSQLHRFCIKEHYDIEVAYLEGSVARIVSGCPYTNVKLVSWIHVEQHTSECAAMSFRNYGESEKCYEQFDKIICVSEYVKKDFGAIYPQLKNIQVLYNTNETLQILEKMNESVAADVFNKDEIKLCGVGKIVPVKGFDKLARIHCRLRREGYSVHSYVLGVGNQQDRIVNYLERQGEKDYFTFLGYQTNPYKYVHRCDLFVCASTAEGFSTAATEAMIVGTPVCTTDVSGMKEMLGEHDEYGIVTANNEEALYQGIKRLLDDPELLKHYKNQALKRGKHFSTEKTVRAVEMMLLEL